MTLRGSVIPLLLLVGCGGGDAPPPDVERPNRIVDVSADPPYVNALDVDPAARWFLMATNEGLWRIRSDGTRATRIRGRLDGVPVGASLVVAATGPGRLVGSGHPDRPGELPEFLGLIRSDDGGRSWNAVSGLGKADYHKLVVREGRLYGYDAVALSFAVSDDAGRTFDKRSTPPAVVIDFDVAPADGDRLIAATEEQLYRSEDGGRTWRPLAAGSGPRVAWAATDALYRADSDGRVHVSADGGDTWREVGRVDGEPDELKALGGESLLMALTDGTLMRTGDGGRAWERVFRP